jgi:hypothetical protein
MELALAETDSKRIKQDAEVSSEHDSDEDSYNAEEEDDSKRMVSKSIEHFYSEANSYVHNTVSMIISMFLKYLCDDNCTKKLKTIRLYFEFIVDDSPLSNLIANLIEDDDRYREVIFAAKIMDLKLDSRLSYDDKEFIHSNLVPGFCLFIRKRGKGLYDYNNSPENLREYLVQSKWYMDHYKRHGKAAKPITEEKKAQAAVDSLTSVAPSIPAVYSTPTTTHAIYASVKYNKPTSTHAIYESFG